MTFINPCPFCGHDDVEIDEVRVGEFSVDCPECECIGPIKPEVMEAIKAWNGATQTIVNRALLAASKDLISRITLDEIQLREMFSYEAHGRQHNFFDDHYQPKIEALSEAISGAESV